jgi:hypothetical protein
VAVHNYANIERVDNNPENPPRNTPLATAPVHSDTIIVEVPKGHPNFPNDNDIVMQDTPKPTFANTCMIDAEKYKAIKTWAKDKAKHLVKKRDRTSHVYWYMKCEVISNVFYSDPKGPVDRPKCLQQYRWSCLSCLA